jgi:hypothetical protein
VHKIMALWCGLFLFFTAARGNAQRFNAFGGIPIVTTILIFRLPVFHRLFPPNIA